ncbi:MAG: hypothetical protein ACK5UE_13220 [Chitinophagales bacterium]|jgi:hypothetical protein|nr:hypothetical protein [Sphingobacteriales bacterium]
MSDFNFYELLKLIIPQIGILVLVYMFLNHWLERDNISQAKKRKDEFNKLILPNQIHAFERMVLFMERIALSSIIPRLNQPDLTAQEFQFILTQEISNEYQHNLSQQLYIPNQTWSMISLAKDQIIQEIIQTAQSLPSTAGSKDLAMKLLRESAASSGKLSTRSVIEALKKDLYKLV